MHLPATPLLIEAICCALLVIGALAVFLLRFARGRLWLGVALGVAAADQLIKLLVTHFFRGGKSLDLPGQTSFVYFENHFLGFEQSDSELLPATLALVAALVLLFICLKQRDYRMGTLSELACALIIGGCLGILVDRMGRGFVIDWLDFGPSSQFVYNLADLAVFAAAALLVARAAQLILRHLGRSLVPAGGGIFAASPPPKEQPQPEAAQIGKLAAQAVRERFGEAAPSQVAAALGVRIEHKLRPAPVLTDIHVRSEYLTSSATIILYDEPLRELAQLIANRRPKLSNTNLTELHVAHELFHHLESGRRSAYERAAHAFVAELLKLDFSPEEFDALYAADNT